MSEFNYEQYKQTIDQITSAPQILKDSLDEINAEYIKDKQSKEESYTNQIGQLQQQEAALIQQYDSIREECTLLGYNLLPQKQRPIPCPFILKDAAKKQNDQAIKVIDAIQNIRNNELERRREEQRKIEKQKKAAEEEKRRQEEIERQKQLERERLAREAEEERIRRENILKKLKKLVPLTITIIVIIIILLVSSKKGG